MNQVKFSRKTLLAVAISSAVLSGCGGGDSDTTQPSTTFSMTAIDGYLVGAQIWADQNGDGVCEVNTGQITAAGGQAEISNDYRNVALCVKAIAGITVDEDRGVIEQGYEIKAPAGSDVITPITDLVVAAAIEKKAADSSLSLTDAVAEAKQEVIEALTATTDSNGESVFDESELFGDYIKSANKKLTVIGEVLADDATGNNELKTKLDIAKKVTEIVKDKTDDALEGYAPIISAPDGSGEVVVTENHAPYLKNSNEVIAVEYEKDDAFDALTLSGYFEERDSNDEITKIVYSLKAINELAKSAEKDFNEHTGELLTFSTNSKGTFKFQAFATDEHGARSKPLPVTINITFEDDLPVIVEEAVTTLQGELNSLEENEIIRQGEAFSSQEFSIFSLFKDDGKSDVTYQVNAKIPGITLAINDDNQLVIESENGAGKAGSYTFTVEASDENNAEWVKAEFTLVILDSPEPVVHPLEGQTFYKIDADAGHQEVYCQSMKFEDGTIWFVDEDENSQTIDPLEQCAEPTVNIGTYTTDGETLSGSITGENPFTLSVEYVDEDPIVKGESTRYVVNLVDKLKDGDESSTQIFYTAKTDAERHLDTTSNRAEFSYYYPSDKGYQEGAINVELKKDPSSESDAFDADLYLDTFEAGWTCEDALQNFGTFALYERNLNDGSKTQVATSRECYDITDNNGIDEQGLVVIDFDFSQSQALTEGNRYSVVAIHSDNNDIASFGASFIYQDTSVVACTWGDSAWDDTTDSPESLTNDFINNGLESCNITGNSFALPNLFTDGVSAVKLRRIDLNPEESEYTQFYQADSQGDNMYLALDDGTINTSWSYNSSYGYIEYSVSGEDGFEAREILAITDYDEVNGQIAVKGFTQNTDWDSLGLGTKANGYGSIFSGVYEVTFNDHK